MREAVIYLDHASYDAFTEYLLMLVAASKLRAQLNLIQNIWTSSHLAAY